MNDDEPKKVTGYVVGYGKPPAEHQFKKGQSGNPLGRPKGKANKRPALRSSDKPTQDMLLDEAYRPIMVREGDTVIELPAIQAVFRAMGVAALKGNRFAQKTLADLVQKVEQEHRDIQYGNLEAFTDYKMKWNREIERCQRLGLPDPKPLPHPDDVLIDYRKGTFRIAGPITKEEKAHFDKMLSYRDQGLEGYRECTQMMKEDPENAKWYLEDRVYSERLFNLVNDQLPERYKVALQGDDEDQDEADDDQEAA
jgi:hypothetical protein